MYLKRKIDDYLLEWKKNMDRLPLIIKGARQIGKTESINPVSYTHLVRRPKSLMRDFRSMKYVWFREKNPVT